MMPKSDGGLGRVILSVEHFNNDSLHGDLKKVYPDEPIRKVKIDVYFGEKVLNIKSDMQGNFSINNLSEIDSLRIEHPKNEWLTIIYEKKKKSKNLRVKDSIDLKANVEAVYEFLPDKKYLPNNSKKGTIIPSIGNRIEYLTLFDNQIFSFSRRKPLIEKMKHLIIFGNFYKDDKNISLHNKQFTLNYHPDIIKKEYIFLIQELKEANDNVLEFKNEKSVYFKKDKP